MTCSPDQSMFVRANNLVEGPGYDEGDEDHSGQIVTMVKDITYFVMEDFAIQTYESCENVQFPPLSMNIMGLLCGAWGVADCSPRRWWNFLGKY